MAQVVPDAALARLIGSGVLAALPGCERGAQPLATAPLTGGTANETYRVQTRAGSFVVRFNDPGGAVLGVDRRRAADRQTTAFGKSHLRRSELNAVAASR